MLTFHFVGLCGFVFKCVKKIFKGQFRKNEKRNILIEIYTLCPFMTMVTFFRLHTSYLFRRNISEFFMMNIYSTAQYQIYLFLNNPNTLSAFGKFQQLQESFSNYICQMSCGQVYDSLC